MALKRAQIVKAIKEHYAAKGDKITGLPGLKMVELYTLMMDNKIQFPSEEVDSEQEEERMAREEDEKTAAMSEKPSQMKRMLANNRAQMKREKKAAMKKELADMKKK
jgi:hypothetical protein